MIVQLETWGGWGDPEVFGEGNRSLDGLDGLRARRGVKVGPSGCGMVEPGGGVGPGKMISSVQELLCPGGSQTHSWGHRGEIGAGTNLRPLSKRGNGGCGVISCESSHDNYLEMKRTNQVGSPCCGGCQPSSWAESWAECSRSGAARSAEVGREVANWVLGEIAGFLNVGKHKTFFNGVNQIKHLQVSFRPK